MSRKLLDQSNLSQLANKGWTTYDHDTEDPSLIEIAAQLGNAVPAKRNSPVVQSLTPRDGLGDRGQSLSKAFGTGSFPLHTDTAHWPIPARFTILADAGTVRDRPTLVISSHIFLTALGEEEIGHSVWKAAGPHGNFLCSLTFQASNTVATRFDPVCMQPQNAAARHAAALITAAKLKPDEIRWRQNLVLIIDNWKALHGRGTSPTEDAGGRILKRVLVMHREQR